MARKPRQWETNWYIQQYFWYHPPTGQWWDGSRRSLTSNRTQKSTYRSEKAAHKYHPHSNGYPSSKWELHCELVATATITTTREETIETENSLEEYLQILKGGQIDHHCPDAAIHPH